VSNHNYIDPIHSLVELRVVISIYWIAACFNKSLGRSAKPEPGDARASWSAAACIAVLAAAPQAGAAAYTLSTLDVPGSTAGSTIALGINEAGQVTGRYTDAIGDHGFVDTGGVFTILNVPGANSGGKPRSASTMPRW
jgi:hypothetical protein